MTSSDDLYQTAAGVAEYIRMCEGQDHSLELETLSRYLSKGSTILEIGMGAGFDLEILEGSYKATGSDYSELFLEIYRAKHPDSTLLTLDARTLKTDKKFNAIYSNKVLHHLPVKDLPNTIERQASILEPGGVVCHSFWRGTDRTADDNLHFNRYLENEVIELFSVRFKLLEITTYGPFQGGDELLYMGQLR